MPAFVKINIVLNCRTSRQTADAIIVNNRIYWKSFLYQEIMNLNSNNKNIYVYV